MLHGSAASDKRHSRYVPALKKLMLYGESKAYLKYVGSNYKVTHNFSSFEVKDQKGCVTMAHRVGACLNFPSALKALGLEVKRGRG